MDLKAAEHKGTVTLESERLILRRFTIEDAEASFQNWAGEAAITKFLRWERHQSVDESSAIIEQWALSYKKKDFYQWAIVLKDLDEPIGAISVVGKNDKVNSVHIGYCIGSRWWNKGYVTEAFKTVIAFLFDVVHVNRIESQHDPVNVASGRVMEKCGLTYEGTMRQADWSNRGIVDARMYGILAADYVKTNGQ
ncbi:MAG: GNAT family protein [Tissierellia bacterium]|nr:GNAT family protein [Tissierellia bacterium]